MTTAARAVRGRTCGSDQRDEWRRAAERHRRERADIFGDRGRGRAISSTPPEACWPLSKPRRRPTLRDRQSWNVHGSTQERAIPVLQGLAADRRAQSSPSNGDTVSGSRPTIEGPAFEQPAPRDIRAFRRSSTEGGSTTT